VEPPRPRKSVGAEVNWGVRFTSDQEAHKFMQVGADLHDPALQCSRH
jgi:hypothetical protein